MLKSLAIQNVALIDRAEIEFSDGLNVLSGETGAGKSVILDCIDFVLGAKADKTMIRYGAEECLVRAEFSIENTAVFSVLSELDVEAEDTVIISRKLNKEGRGGIKINGSVVTAAMLKKLTSLLVDVHGQSEHFFLLQESNQLQLLDKITGEGAATVKQNLKDALSRRKKMLGELTALGGDDGERSRRMDILEFQIGEIERAELSKGEEEELLAMQNRFRYAEKILEGLSAARNALIGENDDWSALDSANGAKRSIDGLKKFDGRYSALSERLEAVITELSDIGETAESFLGELDFDEEERARIDARMDEIKLLKKKYGGSVEAVLAFLENAKGQLEQLLNSGKRREELQIELEACEDEIYKICSALSEIRKKTAEGFSKRIIEQLKTLNIGSASFEIAFQPFNRTDVPKATATGLDSVKFLFSANAGEPLKELSKIISGGEMSRFMIAVKTQLNADIIGTYIFDEIDAGIGGKTAWVIAEKFSQIAAHTQVIAVSHLAQIAAFSDSQFLIEKTEEGDKTHTRISEVTGEARRKELARLIAGDTGELTLKQADELLSRAKTFKTRR